MVDYDMLDAVVDLEAALGAEAPRVHDDLDSNVAAHVIQEKGDYAAIRDAGRTWWSRAACSTTTAPPRRWRTAASSPTGTPRASS